MGTQDVKGQDRSQPKSKADLYSFSACDVNNKGPQLSYDWLSCKHPRKNPVGGASKYKKIQDRVDSEGKYGRLKLWVMGSWSVIIFFFDIISCATFPLFNIIYSRNRRGEVRSKIVLVMLFEVHVSD